MANASGAGLRTTATYHAADDCASADAWLAVYSSKERSIAVRTVALGDDASAGAALSVAAFEDEMATSMDALLGCNRGYSRWADWHLGTFMRGPGASLDVNARYLCERRIGFHNGGLVRSGGSNWARGAAGVGVEFAGHFDGTWFNQSDVSQINYCSASGFGSPSDLVTGEQCEHELSRNGSTGVAVLRPASRANSTPG